MADPESLKDKDEALEFIEINIDTQAKKIEVVKSDQGSGYVGTAGPHPE